MRIFKQERLELEHVISKKVRGPQKDVLKEIEAFHENLKALGVGIYPQISVNYSSQKDVNEVLVESEIFVLTGKETAEVMKAQFTVQDSMTFDRVIAMEFDGTLREFTEANKAFTNYILENDIQVEQSVYVQINQEIVPQDLNQLVDVKLFVKEI